MESLQIVEYLQDVPAAGRRDYRRYPPQYGDPFHQRGVGRGRGNHPDRRPPPFQDQPPLDLPAGRGRMDSPPTDCMTWTNAIFESIKATDEGSRTETKRRGIPKGTGDLNQGSCGKWTSCPSRNRRQKCSLSDWYRWEFYHQC